MALEHQICFKHLQKPNQFRSGSNYVILEPFKAQQCSLECICFGLTWLYEQDAFKCRWRIFSLTTVWPWAYIQCELSLYLLSELTATSKAWPFLCYSKVLFFPIFTTAAIMILRTVWWTSQGMKQHMLGWCELDMQLNEHMCWEKRFQ